MWQTVFWKLVTVFIEHTDKKKSRSILGFLKWRGESMLSIYPDASQRRDSLAQYFIVTYR